MYKNRKYLFRYLNLLCIAVIAGNGIYAQQESGGGFSLPQIVDGQQNTPVRAKNVVSRFVLTFEANGGEGIYAIIADSATVVDLTIKDKIPVKENNVFKGWYEDSAFAKKAMTSIKMEKDITLYAKWILEEATFSPRASEMPKHMVAYPNPIGAGQMLTLELGLPREELFDATIRIVDMQGSVAKTIKTLTPSMQIAMPQKQGQYMIVLYRSGSEVNVLKVIVR